MNKICFRTKSYGHAGPAFKWDSRIQYKTFEWENVLLKAKLKELSRLAARAFMNWRKFELLDPSSVISVRGLTQLERTKHNGLIIANKILFFNLNGWTKSLYI